MRSVEQLSLPLNEIQKPTNIAWAVIFDHKHRTLTAERKIDGELTFPGGKLEEGETPLDGVIREFRVETGVVLKSHDFVPYGGYNTDI